MGGVEVFPRESSTLHKQDHFHEKQERRLFLEDRQQRALRRLLFYVLRQAKKAIPLIGQEHSGFVLLRGECREAHASAVTGQALQTGNKAPFSETGHVKGTCSLLLSHQGMGEIPFNHDKCNDYGSTWDGMGLHKETDTY